VKFVVVLANGTAVGSNTIDGVFEWSVVSIEGWAAKRLDRWWETALPDTTKSEKALVKNDTVHTLKLFQTAMKDDGACVLAEMLRHSSSITTVGDQWWQDGVRWCRGAGGSLRGEHHPVYAGHVQTQIGDDGLEVYTTTM
jgi:hypothetical protein